MFDKFTKLSPMVWGCLAMLIVVGAVLYINRGIRGKWSARMIANAALSIALAFVLSLIRLYKMPQGGSITLASMLPIFLFAYAYGTAPGLLMALVYGFLQWMQDGFYMLTPVEAVMDYLLAYAVLGLAGLMHGKKEIWALPLGCVIGAMCRAVVAVAAGMIFFGEYAPEGTPVLVYSLGYNGLYLIPDTIICIVLAVVPQIRSLSRRLMLER